MEKKLDCKDIGLRQCDYTAYAPNAEEAVRKLGEHMQATHALRGFSKDFYQKAMKAVHDSAQGISGEELCDACSGACTC